METQLCGLQVVLPSSETKPITLNVVPLREMDGRMTHVLFTGPITGSKTTADGTTYDVSPAVIEVNSQEHALEVAHLIGLHYEAVGHAHVVDEDGNTLPFKYDRPVEGVN